MAKQKTDDPPAFEDALGELERITRDLEDGTLGLDASLRRFEEGVRLLRHCYAVLDAAEGRIAQLVGFDGDGNPVLEPFDASATAEQGVAGRRKRKAAAKPADDGDDSEGSSAGRGLF